MFDIKHRKNTRESKRITMIDSKNKTKVFNIALIPNVKLMRKKY